MKHDPAETVRLPFQGPHLRAATATAGCAARGGGAGAPVVHPRDAVYHARARGADVHASWWGTTGTSSAGLTQAPPAGAALDCTRSWKASPAVKIGTALAGIWTVSPVRGLRPARG